MGMPCAVDVEKSVLSCVLNDPAEYWDRAIEVGVAADWWTLPGHRIVWEEVARRLERGGTVDVVTMAQALSDRGELEAVGGVSGLASLYSWITTGAYWGEHIKILCEKHTLRRLIMVARHALEGAAAPDVEASDLLDRTEAEVMAVRESTDRPTRRTMARIASEVIDRLESSLKRGTGLTGIPTGFPALDRLTCGLRGGEMFVIAARPSMGKTAFLLNLIENIAVDQGRRVAMFSCEMPDVQIVERLILTRAQVDRLQVASQGLTAAMSGRLRRSIAEISRAPLAIDDTAGISIVDLRSRARRIKRELGGLDLIGVDYLQLLRSTSRQAIVSREREVAEISAGLKSLAKELNVPVVVLAQLNRGPESRTGKSRGVPVLSDLRESGAIEQDADMVGLLWRSGYYAEGEEERKAADGEANLYLAKNRNGATGDIALVFDAPIMRFNEPTGT